MSAETPYVGNPERGGADATIDAGRATLAVPAKGPTYYASWVVVGLFGFFMALSLWSGLNPVVSVAGFGAFVLLGLAGVVYFGTGRSFEADLEGVRVTHGGRTVRRIPWSDVKRVRFGLRPVTLATSARPGPFLTVTRHGPHRGIDFDTQDYPGHPELDAALAQFAQSVAQLASSRGVPSEWKDWTQPRRRRTRGPG